MRVVVVGAGIAGLVAARVLADTVEHIEIVERDVLPDEPVPRSGTPQARHPHALLVTGTAALDRLFPNITGELTAAGAVTADAADDILFWQLGAFRSRFHSGITVISATRALLEHAIRRRVGRLLNVTVRGGHHVRMLLGGRSGGVRGIVTTDGRESPADLVVDATGRAGSLGWLQALGLPTPSEERVRVNVGYATGLFTRRPGQLDGLLLAGVAETPPRRRFGVAFAVEGDRWQVTLGGWHGDHSPTDPHRYAAFARSLPTDLIARLIDSAEPLGDVRSYTFPASHRRHFERLPDPPPGYVAIGDALCAVNPIYGQGVTMATLQAIALGRDPHDIKGYYRAAARIVDTPWRIATGADYQFPQTTGPRPPGVAMFNRYVRRVVLGAHVSPALHRDMLRVQHLLASPAALMRPRTAARAMWHSRRSPAA